MKSLVETSWTIFRDSDKLHCVLCGLCDNLSKKNFFLNSGQIRPNSNLIGWVEQSAKGSNQLQRTFPRKYQIPTYQGHYIQFEARAKRAPRTQSVFFFFHSPVDSIRDHCIHSWALSRIHWHSLLFSSSKLCFRETTCPESCVSIQYSSGSTARNFIVYQTSVPLWAHVKVVKKCKSCFKS